jgi:hypothetical protein
LKNEKFVGTLAHGLMRTSAHSGGMTAALVWPKKTKIAVEIITTAQKFVIFVLILST